MSVFPKSQCNLNQNPRSIFVEISKIYRYSQRAQNKKTISKKNKAVEVNDQTLPRSSSPSSVASIQAEEQASGREQSLEAQTQTRGHLSTSLPL